MILEGTKEAINEKDVMKIRELSNRTLHSASLYQDKTSIAVAVIVYSLSKIIERTDYREYSSWKGFIKEITRHIGHLISFLKQNKDKKFEEDLERVRIIVSKISGNFRRDVQEVFEKARINKASRIYEHGISMEQTAKILGISLFELAEYAGKTGIADVNLNLTMPVRERIKIAEEMFST